MSKGRPKDPKSIIHQIVFLKALLQLHRVDDERHTMVEILEKIYFSNPENSEEPRDLKIFPILEDDRKECEANALLEKDKMKRKPKKDLHGHTLDWLEGRFVIVHQNLEKEKIIRSAKKKNEKDEENDPNGTKFYFLNENNISGIYDKIYDHKKIFNWIGDWHYCLDAFFKSDFFQSLLEGVLKEFYALFSNEDEDSFNIKFADILSLIEYSPSGLYSFIKFFGKTIHLFQCLPEMCDPLKSIIPSESLPELERFLKSISLPLKLGVKEGDFASILEGFERISQLIDSSIGKIKMQQDMDDIKNKKFDRFIINKKFDPRNPVDMLRILDGPDLDLQFQQFLENNKELHKFYSLAENLRHSFKILNRSLTDHLEHAKLSFLFDWMQNNLIPKVRIMEGRVEGSELGSNYRAIKIVNSLTDYSLEFTFNGKFFKANKSIRSLGP